MRTYLFESELLSIAVLWEDGKAEEILLNSPSQNSTNSNPPPVVKRFFADVALYLAGGRASFSLPINRDRLSAFARKVSEELGKTRCGETVSYAELACRAGHPGAARAVGRVMARNRFPLIVPCHRVTGSNGSLTGFAGGLELKARLLELEQKTA